MTNSYAASFELACPACGLHFNAMVWWLIDTTEHPDLINKIHSGDLHHLSCPFCEQRCYADAPLLLYRPDHEPCLIYTPARHSTSDEDHQQFITLLAILRQSLGENWRDEFIEQLIVLSADNLSTTLLKEAAEKKLTNESNITEEGINQFNIRHLSRLLQIFFLTPTWSEAQHILNRYPELLSSQADILMAQVIQALQNPLARRLVDEHRALLKRCLEIGISEAFNEKEKEGKPKLFSPVNKEITHNPPADQPGETTPLQADTLEQAMELWQRMLNLPDYTDILWPN